MPCLGFLGDGWWFVGEGKVNGVLKKCGCGFVLWGLRGRGCAWMGGRGNGCLEGVEGCGVGGLQKLLDDCWPCWRWMIHQICTNYGRNIQSSPL